MAPKPPPFTPPPPSLQDMLISFPHPAVLLVTLNRPAKLNALGPSHHEQLNELWQWYDRQPALRCAVLTGRGRAFCAGQDLGDWNQRNKSAVATASSGNTDGETAVEARRKWVSGGFAGISNRTGLKPIIAAVNGLCYGGGFETICNTDLVLAAEKESRFGLPEVARGVVALAGALPRIVLTLGRQRASEMVLLGRTGYSAAQMESWGIVNKVVSDDGLGTGTGQGETSVAREAVRWAVEIANNSPDSVLVSREGLRLGWEGVGPVTATELLERGMWARIEAGENMSEGVMSFVEKRKPKWVDSKL